MWGIGAAVEVANCQGARFDGDAHGGVVQIGDAGCGEGAADGRRRMQRVEGDAVGSRGADVGKIVAIGDVAAGKRLGAPQGKGERAGFLMLAAVRIVRAQALPAGVIQIDFRQGEDVGFSANRAALSPAASGLLRWTLYQMRRSPVGGAFARERGCSSHRIEARVATVQNPHQYLPRGRQAARRKTAA